MKNNKIKLILFICLFFSLGILLFCLSLEEKAYYDASKFYKQEMQKIINKNYGEKIKKINKISAEANLMYKNYQNNPFDLNLYEKFKEKHFEKKIEAVQFDFYSDLIKTTSIYLSLGDKDIPKADCCCTLYEFLIPYFVKYKINQTKVRKFSEYATIKKKKITDIYLYEQRGISIPKAYIIGYLEHCPHFNNPVVLEYIKKHPNGTFADKIRRFLYYNLPLPLNVCIYAKFHGFDYVLRSQFDGESVAWQYKGKYTVYQAVKYTGERRYILIKGLKLRFDEGNEFKEIHNCYPQSP